MKKQLSLMTFLLACLLVNSVAFASDDVWNIYEFGGIRIDIPYGTKFGQVKHFDKINDDVLSADSIALKMPDGMIMLINVMNRSETYMSPLATEKDLSSSFKKNTSLSLVNSFGDGKASAYYEGETGTNDTPAYVLAANKKMQNKEFTYICYLFAKNCKVVNILYVFKNDNPRGGATDALAKKMGAIMDRSIKSFAFE